MFVGICVIHLKDKDLIVIDSFNFCGLRMTFALRFHTMIEIVTHLGQFGFNTPKWICWNEKW